MFRVKADGSSGYEPVAQFDPQQNAYVPAPIDLSVQSDQVYLILFATGIRNRSDLSRVTAKIGNLDAQVLYAGPQDGFQGIDQINARFPRELFGGAGTFSVYVQADSVFSNTVTVRIK